MDLKKIFLYAVGLFAFIAVFSFFDIDLSVFFSVKAPLLIVVPAMLSLLLIPLYAFRTHLLVRSLGLKSLPFFELVRIEFVNKLVTQTAPAKLNIPAKALMLFKRGGISKSDAISVSSFEYFLDTFVLLLLSVFGFFAFAQISSQYSAGLGIIVFALVFSSVGFFFFPSRVYDFLISATRRFERRRFLRFIPKSFFYLKGIRRGWIDMFLHRYMLLEVPVVTMFFVLNALSVEFLLASLGLPWVSFWFVVSAVAIARLFSGISNVPGGFGIREASLVILLGLAGVPGDASFFVAVAFRIVGIPQLLAGYYVLFRHGKEYFI